VSALDLGSLQVLLVNETVEPRVEDAVKAKLPQVTLKYGYGLADLTPPVTITPSKSKVPSGCVGIPLPETELVVDSEGFLRMKGPQIPVDYLHVLRKIPGVKVEEPEKPAEHVGFFKTPDKATIAKNGSVFVTRHTKAEDL